MRSNLILAIWTLLAGAGIPLIGVLNSGMAQRIGNPFGATAVMFAVAFFVALGLSLPLYGVTGYSDPVSSFEWIRCGSAYRLLRAFCHGHYSPFRRGQLHSLHPCRPACDCGNY